MNLMILSLVILNEKEKNNNSTLPSVIHCHTKVTTYNFKPKTPHFSPVMN